VGCKSCGRRFNRQAGSAGGRAVEQRRSDVTQKSYQNGADALQHTFRKGIGKRVPLVSPAQEVPTIVPVPPGAGDLTDATPAGQTRIPKSPLTETASIVEGIEKLMGG